MEKDQKVLVHKHHILVEEPPEVVAENTAQVTAVVTKDNEDGTYEWKEEGGGSPMTASSPRYLLQFSGLKEPDGS